MKKILLTVLCAFTLSVVSVSAVDVYINPGHGLWDGNGRNLAVVGHALGDTLGFWESNTNLWKAYYLRDALEAVGLTCRMSHTQVGPKGYDGIAPYGGKEVDVIAEESSKSGATYFISIHSNATSEGSTSDWPAFYYNGGVGDSYNMAKNANLSWLEVWTNDLDVTNKIEYCSYSQYINGDLIDGGAGSSSSYGVLRTNSVPGFMSEAFFHTYRPHRHRACNPDRCCVEGEAYARPIRAFFSKPASTKGFIYGVVVSDTEKATEDIYLPAEENWQAQLPLQGVKVYLSTTAGDTVKGITCYPYVARCLTNQDHYTTDNYHNGVFVFQNIEPGTYNMTFVKNGYQDQTVQITVTANHTACKVVRMSKNIDPNARVIYELNGGQVVDSLIAHVTEPYTVPSPTKEGAYFLGWFWDELFTEGPVAVIQPGADGTLYAKWGTSPLALNPYATKLAVTDSSQSNMVTISYTLNAVASALDFCLIADDAVKGTVAITDAALLTAGPHTATIDLTGQRAGSYTWALKATGFVQNEPIKGTENCEKFNFYWGEGVAVNNHPASPYFGDIYVTESWGGKSTKAGKTSVQGLTIFSSDLTTNGTVYTGTYNGGQPINWVSDPGGDGNGFFKTTHGPQRISIDADDYVYINDDGRWQGENYSQVWRFYPSNPAADWTPMLDINRRESATNKQYTRANAMTVTGSGPDRRMYIVDWSDDIVYFNIGNNTNISSGRTQFANLPSATYAQIPNRTFEQDHARDGFWMFQCTGGSTTKPLVSHWTSAGVCNCKKMADTDADDNHNGGGAVSEDGSMIAFCGGSSVLVYKVTYSGLVPSLTKLYSIPNVKVASGLAFDVVNNLYFVSSDTQYFEGYALPRTDNSYTTHAGDMITVTGDGTGLNKLHPQTLVQKVIRDGKLFIIRDGRWYDIMGAVYN